LPVALCCTRNKLF